MQRSSAHVFSPNRRFASPGTNPSLPRCSSMLFFLLGRWSSSQRIGPHAHSHSHVWVKEALASGLLRGTGVEYHVEYHLFHSKSCPYLHLSNANARLGCGTRTLTRVGKEALASGFQRGVAVAAGFALVSNIIFSISKSCPCLYLSNANARLGRGTRAHTARRIRIRLLFFPQDARLHGCRKNSAAVTKG